MTRTDDDSRIAALEREVRDLRALLAPPPQPQPKVVEAGARVYTVSAAINPAFVRPSEAELDQLLAIACRCFPILRAGISTGCFAAQDEADFRREFETAFHALGSIRRTPDGVDEKHGPDHWIRAVQGRLQGDSQIMHLLPFTAAVVAHGDIPLQLHEACMTSSAFGLRDDGAGVAATDKWRQVISSNVTRPSLPQYRARSMGRKAGSVS